MTEMSDTRFHTDVEIPRLYQRWVETWFGEEAIGNLNAVWTHALTTIDDPRFVHDHLGSYLVDCRDKRIRPSAGRWLRFLALDTMVARQRIAQAVARDEVLERESRAADVVDEGLPSGAGSLPPTDWGAPPNNPGSDKWWELPPESQE